MCVTTFANFTPFFRCNDCGKVYHALHALNEHIKRHHAKQIEKQSFICDVCKKTFISKVGIKRHLQTHSETTETTKTDDEQYIKFITGLVFSHFLPITFLFYIKIILNLFKENFDMSCDHCEAVFNTFHDARRHYKQFHNDDKGYIKYVILFY